ncbi:hypothetical protein PV08_08758 [Exophiala spinifera]|uniref:Transcription factor domain-containing protein n=1 Tax=Exophiala spinifera TaxID=91928 RepID=A0A0D2B4H2_9EURO|nr:uncharacterized protein PV08_08758 [Exophiala spinifera]KIW13570.1 hypothetical protein PV08_08758 [Exophiala spinifera]
MLTAAAAHRLQLIQTQGRPPNVVTAFRWSYSFHKSKTYQLVNQLLTEDEVALADTTVGTILYLAAADLISGDISSALIHLAGLSQVVKLRGGIQTLPRLLAFFLNFTDCMLAMTILERPRLPLYSARIAGFNHVSATAAQPPPPPIEQPAFHGSELSQILDRESLGILSEIQTLDEGFEHFTTRVATVSDLDDIEYRCVATQHRLLSFDYKSLMFTDAVSPTVHTESQILQGCCRLTMLIYFATGVWRFPDVLPESAQLMSIISVLENLLASLSPSPTCASQGSSSLDWQPAHPEALLWICFYTAFSATGSQRTRFVELIRRTCNVLRVRRFRDAEAVLDKFLYKRAVFCRPFLEVWEEVVYLNTTLGLPDPS